MLLKLKSWFRRRQQAPNREQDVVGLYCLHFPETEEARQDQARQTQGLVFRQLAQALPQAVPQKPWPNLFPGLPNPISTPQSAQSLYLYR